MLCCTCAVPCELPPQVEVAAAHRGRLSLLVNLLGKPLGALCTEMEGKQSDFRVGDVKYHLGEAHTHAGLQGSSCVQGLRSALREIKRAGCVG
jgi:hypothetical protein